jgi:hypothetical protein
MPSWSISTPGYGVRSTGIGDGNTPSLTSQTLEFGEGSFSNNNNYVTESISTSASVAMFVCAEMIDRNSELSLYNPVSTTTAILVDFGDPTWTPNDYRDSLRMFVVTGSNSIVFKSSYGKQVTWQLEYNEDDRTPNPGDIFTLAVYKDSTDVGHMMLNGIEADTVSNFTPNQQLVQAVAVGARGHWNDAIYPRPIYCSYVWVDELNSVIPTEGQFKQLAKDPFGPFRQANRLFLPDLPRSFGSVVVPSDTQRQPITFTTNPSPELITNGGFDTNSDWNLNVSWSIADGVLYKEGGVFNNTSQNFDTQSNKKYLTTFTVASYSGSGQVRIALGASGTSTWRTSVGTYTEILTPAQTGYIRIISDANFSGSIDNVSVKELADSYVNISQAPELVTNGGFDTDSGYTKDTGWTISGGKLRATSAGSSAAAFQTRLVEIGETVMVTFTVDSISEGAVKAFVGGSSNAGAARTTPGTYREIFVAGAANTTGLVASGTTTCVIDNFSVRRVNIKITP